MVESIQPAISSRVSIKLVPLYNRGSASFMPGHFVIRVVVPYGERDLVYFFKNGEKDMYIMRNEKSVRTMETKDALEEQRKRALKPLDEPVLLHKGACELPLAGINVTHPPSTLRRHQPENPERNDFHSIKPHLMYVAAVGLTPGC